MPQGDAVALPAEAGTGDELAFSLISQGTVWPDLSTKGDRLDPELPAKCCDGSIAFGHGGSGEVGPALAREAREHGHQDAEAPHM